MPPVTLFHLLNTFFPPNYHCQLTHSLGHLKEQQSVQTQDSFFISISHANAIYCPLNLTQVCNVANIIIEKEIDKVNTVQSVTNFLSLFLRLFYSRV